MTQKEGYYTWESMGVVYPQNLQVRLHHDLHRVNHRITSYKRVISSTEGYTTQTDSKLRKLQARIAIDSLNHHAWRLLCIHLSLVLQNCRVASFSMASTPPRALYALLHPFCCQMCVCVFFFLWRCQTAGWNLSPRLQEPRCAFTLPPPFLSHSWPCLFLPNGVSMALRNCWMASFHFHPLHTPFSTFFFPRSWPCLLPKPLQLPPFALFLATSLAKWCFYGVARSPRNRGSAAPGRQPALYKW